MIRIIHGKTFGLKDVEKVIELLNTLDQHPLKRANSFFDPNREIVLSRAPGRLDIMGGIADYSGSLVLQLPIKEATIAAAQPASDHTIKIISLTNSESAKDRYFEMRLEDFFVNNMPIDYKSAQQYFADSLSTQWAAYIAGLFLVFIKEKGVDFEKGANILIYSDVPEGKGVSSSAALEVAAMSAVGKAFGIETSAFELAALCQKVENLVVGAPCGIMDQMTSVFGKRNQLMALLCQPAQLQSFIQIPDELAFWGIDSGIKHSVSGGDYTSVRIGAFMGQRIILEFMKRGGCPSVPGNYLANISPDVFEKHFAHHLPIKMKGLEFIQRYQSTFDSVTDIYPESEYNIRNPTAHPIYENDRVHTFSELLNKPTTEETFIQLGELMYLSHKSYSACGLGSSGTDRLVEFTKQTDSDRGLFGAKITGGGSGGTVAVLGRHDAEHAVEEIIDKYNNETGHKPYLFKGSSMGSDEFGSILLKSI